MIRRAMYAVLLTLPLLSLLSGCAALAEPDPLDGTRWELRSIDGAAPLAGQPITLAFEDGEAHGSSGCNTYSGAYGVSAGSLTVDELMSTEMACLEPERMEQEAAYLSRLAAVRSFSLSEGRLELTCSGDQSLTFAPQPDA